MNARSTREIVFTRGTTESINLLATSFGQAFVKAGDEILITGMEHHSNIVPWQLLCERTGAKLRVIPLDDRGDLILDDLGRLLTERTKLVGVVHVSNALGTINPVKALIGYAHGKGVPVLVDGAQSIPHLGGRRARPSTATSSPSRATRSTARPASASSTARSRGSRRCPRTRGAAT